MAVVAMVEMATVGDCSGDNDDNGNVTALEVAILATTTVGNCSGGYDGDGNIRQLQQWWWW